jgi:hypothetical protein
MQLFPDLQVEWQEYVHVAVPDVPHVVVPTWCQSAEHPCVHVLVALIVAVHWWGAVPTFPLAGALDKSHTGSGVHTAFAPPHVPAPPVSHVKVPPDVNFCPAGHFAKQVPPGLM